VTGYQSISNQYNYLLVVYQLAVRRTSEVGCSIVSNNRHRVLKVRVGKMREILINIFPTVP
jgi:hypothetical protein